MKKNKMLIALTALVLLIGASSVTAMAASNYNIPAQALAALTGKNVENMEEFRTEALELKKDRLEEMVKAGTITQERADEIIKVMEERQANCIGTGVAGNGWKMGAGFGRMNGNGWGLGGGFGGCGGGFGSN